MINTLERIGRFTSSQIWKLTTQNAKKDNFGAPALTYIGEKKAERSLGRSIDLGKGNQSTVWGNVMEYYCDKYHLDLSYFFQSKETNVHPKFKFWSGSPDFVTNHSTGDIKSFEPKRFYELTMWLIKLNDGLVTLDEFKKDEKEVYWQVVSNCILLGKSKGEIISYTPSEKQLYEIRSEIEETNILEKLGIEPWQGRYIVEKPIYELPYIPEGIEFPNFVKFEFEIPKEDIEFLTHCVTSAELLLNN